MQYLLNEDQTHFMQFSLQDVRVVLCQRLNSLQPLSFLNPVFTQHNIEHDFRNTTNNTATLCSTVSVQYLMSPYYVSYQSSEDSRLKLWDRLSTGVARGGSLTLPSLGLF